MLRTPRRSPANEPHKEQATPRSPKSVTAHETGATPRSQCRGSGDTIRNTTCRLLARWPVRVPQAYFAFHKHIRKGVRH